MKKKTDLEKAIGEAVRFLLKKARKQQAAAVRPAPLEAQTPEQPPPQVEQPQVVLERLHQCPS